MKRLLVLLFFFTFTVIADDYLVVHGLNTNQSMLSDLQSLIRANGDKVHSLVLTGHEQSDWEAFTKSNTKQWETDFLVAYQALGKKRHLIAYSLGALVAMYTASKHKSISFQTSNLFSPAVSTRWYVSALKPLSWFGVKKIKSMVPDDERVHPHTPMSAYMSIFEMQEWLTDTVVSHLDFGATSIFIDKRDKLVSYSGVLKWITKNSYNWKIKNLVSKRSAHHMVTSKKYLDSDSWLLVKKTISSKGADQVQF